MTTLLVLWALGATGLALYHRADAGWWRHECQRRTERQEWQRRAELVALPDGGNSERGARSETRGARVLPEDGERPFVAAKMPDKRERATRRTG